MQRHTSKDVFVKATSKDGRKSDVFVWELGFFLLKMSIL